MRRLLNRLLIAFLVVTLVTMAISLILQVTLREPCGWIPGKQPAASTQPCESASGDNSPVVCLPLPENEDMCRRGADIKYMTDWLILRPMAVMIVAVLILPSLLPCVH